jgi:hypothetical protein
MRNALALIVLASATRSAHAQPGVAPSVPSPATYRPLDPDDQRALDVGEISDNEIVLGAVLAAWPGFGVGQAVQGRWRDRGWIFTLGEGGSLGVFAMSGLACPGASGPCANSRAYYGVAVASFFGWVAFHIGGVVDAVVAPKFHNQRVRRLRARSTGSPQLGGVYVAPVNGGGEAAGVVVRF